MGWCVVRVLLDSGSQETFISSNICETLGIKKENSSTTMRINMLDGKSKQKKVNRVAFKLAPISQEVKDSSIDMEAWTIDKVCVPLQEVKFDAKQCNYLKELNLAENFPRKEVTVDLLVGIDQYYNLVEGVVRRGPEGFPIATSSKFGWLLSGPVPGQFSKPVQTFSMLTVTRVEEPSSILKRFWELDVIGLVEKPRKSQYTADEEYAMEQFEKNIMFDGERYTVSLPWKQNFQFLVNNYHQAKQRFGFDGEGPDKKSK